MPYGTDQGFQDWLDANGYTLPDDAPAPAVLRARGTNYIDGLYEFHWDGRRTDGVTQELGWPRTGARLHCRTIIADDAIPVAVVNAAYRAAYLEAVTPGVLSSSATAGQRVSREKVDVIEVAYHNDGPASAGSGNVGFVDSEIDGAMRAFICEDVKFFLRSVGGRLP
jgi:hypothetical protein|tara:strand:+ start:25693 stop:26193 length:501 start_codon:yes stop_codon:yes gene_type:complete